MEEVTEIVSVIFKIKAMTTDEKDTKKELKFWIEVFLMSVAVSVATSLVVRQINKLMGH